MLAGDGIAIASPGHPLTPTSDTRLFVPGGDEFVASRILVGDVDSSTGKAVFHNFSTAFSAATPPHIQSMGTLKSGSNYDACALVFGDSPQFHGFYAVANFGGDGPDIKPAKQDRKVFPGAAIEYAKPSEIAFSVCEDRYVRSFRLDAKGVTGLASSGVFTEQDSRRFSSPPSDAVSGSNTTVATLVCAISYQETVNGVQQGGVAFCTPYSASKLICSVKGVPIGAPSVLRMSDVDPAWGVAAVVKSSAGKYSLVAIPQIAGASQASVDLPEASEAQLRTFGLHMYVVSTSNYLRIYRLQLAPLQIVPVNAIPILLPGNLIGAPMLNDDGDVIVSCKDGVGRSTVLAVSTFGETSWSYQASGGTLACAAAVGGARVALAISTPDARGAVSLVDLLQADPDYLPEVVRSTAATFHLDTLLPDSTYAWLGTNGPDFNAWLPNQKPSADWILTGSHKFSRRGIPVEDIGASGVTQSVLPDKRDLMAAASFGACNVAEGEAHFTAFEEYESLAFIRQQKAAVTADDSYTGVNALRVEPGGVAQFGMPPRPLTRPPGKVILSAWVKTGPAYAPGDGAYIAICRGAGQPAPVGEKLNVVATNGEWRLLQQVVDLRALKIAGDFLSLMVANNGNGPVLVDHVWFAPLGSHMTADIRDEETWAITEHVDSSGEVERMVYTARKDLAAKVRITGQVAHMVAGAFSRSYGIPPADARFSIDHPSSAFTVDCLGGGDHFRFRTKDDLQGWRVLNGEWRDRAIVMTQPGELAHDLAELSTAVRFQVTGAAPGAETPLVNVQLHGIQIVNAPHAGGGCMYTIQGDGAPSASYTAPAGEDWLIVHVSEPDEVNPGQARCVVYFYVNGVQIFCVKRQYDGSALGLRIKGSKGATFRDIVIGRDPAPGVAYSDGDGHVRQTQEHVSAQKVIMHTEVLYDRIGREAFKTLPVYKSAGALCEFGFGFEKDFVNGRDPHSDDKNARKLWSTDPSDPDRGKMSGLAAGARVASKSSKS